MSFVWVLRVSGRGREQTKAKISLPSFSLFFFGEKTERPGFFPTHPSIFSPAKKTPQVWHNHTEFAGLARGTYSLAG